MGHRAFVAGAIASAPAVSGSVYRLKWLKAFPGAYLQLREGWALGDQGRGALWLRNKNGVTLKLAAQRQGLRLPSAPTALW